MGFLRRTQNFCEITTLDLFYVKEAFFSESAFWFFKSPNLQKKYSKKLSWAHFLKNFVAFSECMNFTNYSIFFRAGSVDALIVLATQSVKNDFLYQEAFIATYRTFVSTHDLLEKLVQRFRKFNNRKDEQQMIYKRVAHCAFSLMVSSIFI